MDHKREEETELKFPENPVSCTPKQPDPITRSAKLPRPRCGNLLKNPDPIKNISLNRCSGCQKKVGLTGFRCRCGELFCTEHRYTDRHDCSYDYKAAGREAIARDNPVVRPVKLVKV